MNPWQVLGQLTGWGLVAVVALLFALVIASLIGSIVKNITKGNDE